VDTNLSYSPAQNVILIDSTYPYNNCHALVSVYSPTTGILVLDNITNINGSFSANAVPYTVNVEGAVGPTGPLGPAGVASNTGSTGPTGPLGIQKALSTAYYYLSADVPITGPSTQTIVYNTNEPTQTQGLFACTYNTASGRLTNTSSDTITLLVSGQITTDNTIVDYTYDQPSVSIVKGGTDSLLTSSAINFKGSAFSTSLVLRTQEYISINYTYPFPSETTLIKSGAYNTHIVFTQLDNVLGPRGPTGFAGPAGPAGSAGLRGPTGPAAVQGSLSSAYYYLSADTTITGPETQTIVYDTNEPSQTEGQFACTYDIGTGFLTNNTSSPVTLLVSGQVTTNNITIDYVNDQPSISIIKGGVSILTSAAISFKGSVFSTSLILQPAENLYISYSYYLPGDTISIKGGANPFNTHIMFTQLDNVQGPTGPIGPSGGRYLTLSQPARIMPPQVITLIVDTGLSYTPGLSVIVVDSSERAINCIGSIALYSPVDGMLAIENITNITGLFSDGLRQYTVNLTGGIGPTGPPGQQGGNTTIFDGGASDTVYTYGPVFDCGNSTAV
jgi:hypothetical protein